jgi:hypothetical protein
MGWRSKLRFGSRSGPRRLLPAQTSLIRSADVSVGPIGCGWLLRLTASAPRGIDAAPTIDEDGQAVRKALARNRKAWPERINRQY